MVDTYRLRVSGHLDDRWSEWLGGLAVQRQGNGTTELVGPVVDQAALHGVISRIRDLGLPLLSLDRIADPDIRTEHESSATMRPGGGTATPTTERLGGGGT
jgi:hypothetical protein